MKWNTLVEALAYWAENDPDKVCFIEGETDRRCTYRQMWQWAVAVARRLRSLGLRRGDRVVTRVGGLLETNAAMFGAFLAGGVYCPVEQHIKEIKLRELLQEYGAKVLISSDPFGWNGAMIPLAETLAGLDSGKNPPPLPEPDALAIIVFTTGTTGKAKGVMHTHRTHLHPMMGWVAEWGLGREDVFLSVQPLERAGGMFHYYSAIVAGGTAVHHGGVVFSARVFEVIRQYGVTAIYMQTPALQMLMNADMQSFHQIVGQIHILGVGGAAVSETLKKTLAHAMPKTKLYVFYGSSENVWTAYYRFNDQLDKPNCVGKAAPGVEIAISGIDEDVDSPNKNAGCVLVKSEYLFAGYYNADALYRAAVVDGTLITADIGHMDEEGRLYILGRKDDVINSGGYKIAPYEVEEVVSRLDGVLECACVGVPNPVLGQALKLFVRMEKGAEFSAQRISLFLEQRLERYKLPRFIAEIEDFPRVGNTPKINKRELQGK